MGIIKSSIKKLVMHYDFTRKIYYRWIDNKFNLKLSKTYGNMTRKEIFSHIYHNHTWGGVNKIIIPAKAHISKFM